MKKTIQENGRKLIFALFSFVLLAPGYVFAQSGWSVDNLEGMRTGLPAQRIYDIIKNFMMWVLALFGIVGIIGFVVAGIMYITAFGDSTKMENAKNAMLYSIIGIIVGLAGLVVITAVDRMLRGTSGTLF